jgi:plasmid maintenance system antidote protein VapI
MTIQELKQFFEERPSLSVNGVTLEAGLSESYLSKILRGNRSLSQKTIDKLKPVLKKYGYGCE